MKKSLLIFFAFSISFTFYGQDNSILDSLQNRLNQPLSAKEIVDTHVQMAFEYSGVDSIKTNSHLGEALKLAKENQYSQGIADAYYVLSRNSMLKGDYSSSEAYLFSLQLLVDSIQYQKGKANVLFGLGWLSYYQGQYQKSLLHHKSSLKLRRSLDNKEDISSSLRGIGITYKLLGDFEQALYFLNQSLDLETDIHNKSGIAECLNHIGVIKGLQGDYASALNAYYQALDHQLAINDKSGLSYTYQNIGFVHYRQGDFQKTVDYYEKSLKIRVDIGEVRGVAQITHYLGEVLHKQKDYQGALAYYFSALEQKQKLMDRRGEADGYLNIGRLYADQDDYQEAIKYQNKSLKLSRAINSDWGVVNALIGLGRSHSYLNQNMKAKSYLWEGIKLARKSQLKESIKEAANLLAEVEMKLGHYKDAYEAQVMFQEVSEDLSNEALTKKITLLEAEHRFKKVKDSIQFANEKEKFLLDKKISDQSTAQFVEAAIIVVLVIVLGILFSYYRLRTNSNKRLSILNERVNERNESLRQLNSEKNNLIRIVAHDLKNPLASIIGANQLMDESKMGDDDKELKKLVHNTSSRMSKMISDILDVEMIEKNAQDIRVKPFDLSTTVNEISDELSGQAAKKDIEIQKRIGDNLVGLVDERYIFQVIENLLSNAIKFSPPNKKVVVELSKISNDLVLHVKDEGPGISGDDKKKLFQKFQRLSARPTGNESSTGLGLAIVKQIVEKMEGRVWVESELGKGASFYVALQAA